jgi:parallel beta-helix repeat protein
MYKKLFIHKLTEVFTRDNALNKVIGLLFCFTLIIIINTQNVSAQYFESVTINADGTIEPATAPMQRIRETYLLTGNVGSITVKRSNIVLEGASGYMLPGIVTSYDNILKKNITTLNSGGIYLEKVGNVTVKNFFIKESETGIYLDRATNCIITNNTIIGTHTLIPQLQVTSGIFVWGGNYNIITGNKLANDYNGIFICYDSQNTIVGNTITNSTSTAILFHNASRNIVYYNKFIDNTVQASFSGQSINIWDKEDKGNYWSNYDGTDANGDGVGDTPFKIDENNSDHYPLMKPFEYASPSSYASKLEPSQTNLAVVIVAGLTTIAVASSAGVIVYFKKRKR